MISFLSPLFLAGALAAAIPIVLHLLKRKPDTVVKFAPVELLRHAPVQETAHRRLRELLLLALRVAALVLLALAFARPFFASAATAAAEGLSVVALDTSMSLSAGGLFDRAQAAAREAIRRAPAGYLVAVVTFDTTARVAALPSSDRGLATAAIDSARPGYRATRYRAALSVAADLITASAAKRSTIVVVTDLQESGWDAGDRAVVPESTELRVADVGTPLANLAVTAVRLQGDRVIATIRNAGAQPRDSRVHLSVHVADGQAPRDAGDAAVSIGANQTSDVTLPSVRGQWAVVSVDDPGGIAGDNSRYVVLDNATRPAVLVVTDTGDLSREAFYVQQALAAGQSTHGYETEGVGAGGLARVDSARIAAYRAVLLLSTRGLERHGRELVSDYVRKGGGLFIAASPQVDGEVVAETLGGGSTIVLANPAGLRDDRATAPRTLVPADVRHPVFRPFGAGAATLGLVKFEQAASIRADGCQTVARFTNGETALADCSSGDGHALVFASDLNNRWNDFPVHATFVPFLHEVVRYLAGSQVVSSELLIGDPAPTDAGETPGVRAVRINGSSRLVAVNVDPKESDLTRLSPDDFETAVTRLKSAAVAAARVEAGRTEDVQHVWRYLLGLMLAALMVETVVASRTA